MFEKLRKIPSPEEFIKLVPLSNNLKELKSARDEEIKKVVTGETNKFLVIIGPCSADNEDAVCDYVHRLAAVQEKTRDKLVIVPRVYTNKPRTTGEGYKGMLHQPDPESAPNMVEGIVAIRRMHIKAISESGLSAADEMLYPDNLPYVDDMLSYIAVGARSVENQQHRLTASAIDVAVGMKNPMSGDLAVMLNSIQAAQTAHDFIYNGHEVKTAGNPLAHAIMRGSVNRHGESIQNYHYEDLLSAHEQYVKRKLVNPMVIVDANHSNSKKQYKEQIRIAHEVLYSRKKNCDLKKLVRGLMIESYLEEGSQPVGGGVYGKSITDACIGWADSERLIYYIADNC
ncbi:MAG: 3-deoxy-7-phosphoheptulonate synthase [Clostridiales bacterium]|jgi:3-deoxy-7-phosphoheptulonate synthase|nr:3-deoxy-7-phosphoheptulonate synthase [Clostridiales bacterium]